MMKFITTQMTTNEVLKENQLRQDDTIRQLGREVERLIELVVAMKSTNQPPNEPKVIPEVVDFDDSDDDSLLQDELYQKMEETVQEQTDDEPLDGLMHLLHEEPEKENSVDKPSKADYATHLYEELQLGYTVPTVLDPFWESFCRKKNNLESARQIAEYLKLISLEGIDAHATRETDKSQKPGWYNLLPGDQCVGKSSDPDTYHFYHLHFTASVGCFVLKPGN